MLDVPGPHEDEARTLGRANRRPSTDKAPYRVLEWGTVFAAIRRWRFRALTLLGAIALFWYFGMPILLGPVVNVDTVIRADFVQSVVASGRVEAPFRVNVGSQITG